MSKQSLWRNSCLTLAIRIGASASLLTCSLGAVQPARAQGVLLDFEGIGDLVSIQNFYNGGAAGNGNIGPSYNVSFVGNALSIVDADAGGSGNFAKEPSPSSIMFWLNEEDTHMNYSPGFSQFSAYYAAAYYPGYLSFWDGSNGTGAQIGSTVSLDVNGDRCGGDPSGSYNCWTQIHVALERDATSVTFGGSANYIGFDNIAFNPHELPYNNVPGPLPILGVAVAFRASRTLRKRLKASAARHC